MEESKVFFLDIALQRLVEQIIEAWVVHFPRADAVHELLVLAVTFSRVHAYIQAFSA